MLFVASAARAQCTLSSSPRVFEPAPGPKPAKFGPGFTNGLDLYQMPGGERRLIVMENYGYAVFSLANPAAPSILGYQDMSLTVPQQGDGQSIVVALAAAGNGSRALVNWKQSPHGTFLMKPNVSTFTFAGDIPTGRAAGGVAVDTFPTRSLAYALSMGGLYVADVTNFVNGNNAITAGSIPAQLVATAPVGTSPNHLAVVGHFIVYSTGAAVVVIDGSNPGTGDRIANYFVAKVLAPTVFGLGAADRILNVAAALHPITGALTIVAEGANSSYVSTGIGVATTADNVTFTAAAPPFHVPAPYGTSGGSVTSAVALAATATDLLSLSWEYGGGVLKLVTLSLAGWGTDLTPDVTVDSADVPEFVSPQAMRAFAAGTDLFAYVAAQQGGVAFSFSCPPVYAVGDADGNGVLAIGDVFALVNSLFAGGPAPVGSGDVNGDGNVDAADVFALVNYLFAGGAAPVR